MANSSENSDAKYMDRHQKVGARAVELGGDEVERDFARSGQIIYTKPTGGTGTPTGQITRHGITWTFSQESEAGQYVTGDWWVVGPVSVVGITPQTGDFGGRIMHGSMKNLQPGWSNPHGFDTNTYFGFGAQYSQAANAAWGVSPSSPLILQPGDSLISVESQVDMFTPGAASEGGPAIFKTAAVLTVVSEAPPDGSFRPPYSSAGDAPFNVSSIIQSKLTQTFNVTANTTNFSTDIYAQAIQDCRLHLEWIGWWLSRVTHPADNMPNYGQYIAGRMGELAMYMFADVPLASKLPYLYGLIQIGIDWDELYLRGMSWPGAGGQMNGRKLPIMLKRAILGQDTAIGNTPQRFSEDDQSFFVEETSPGVYNYGYGSYTAAMVGMPEYSFGHWHKIPNPVDDESSLTGDPYRLCCTSKIWFAAALCAYELGVRGDWGHEPFFDYLDRYRQTFGVAAAIDEGREWPSEMWDAHRASYSAYPILALEEGWPQ